MMLMMASRLDIVAIDLSTGSSSYSTPAHSLICSLCSSISSRLTSMLPILPGDGFVLVLVACAVCTGMGENRVYGHQVTVSGEPLRE